MIIDYGGPQVQQAALPGARSIGPATPAQYGGAVDAYQRREQELIDRADTAAVSGAVAAARAKYRERMYGDNGLYYANGKDLFDRRSTEQSGFEQDLAQIGSTLTTERQKAAWLLHSNGLQGDFSDSVESRVGVEWRKFQGQTLDASLNEATELAVQRAAHGEVTLRPDGSVDTSKVDLANEELAGLIETYGDEHATELPIDANQWKQLMVEQRVSASHAGAIDQIRAKGDDVLAKAYFEQVKGELTAKDRERLQTDVRRSTVAGEAERQAASIFTTAWDDDAVLTRTGPTIAEMRAAGHAQIDKIADQDVQDSARQRFEQRMDRAERTVQNTRAEHYDNLDTALLDNGGNLTAIQNDKRWNSLDGRQHENLIKRAQQIGGGDLVVNDNALYYSRLRMATDPASMAKFADMVLTEDATKLDGQHLDRLQSLQVSVRQMLGRPTQGNADAKEAEKVFNTARTHLSIMQGYADQVSLDLTSKDRNDFLNVYDEAVVSAQVSAGRELTSTEYTQVGQNLLLDFAIDRSWDDPLDDVEKEVWKLNIGDITIEDVPQVQRDAITDVLLEQGQVVSEERIRAEYLRGLRIQGVR